MMAEGRIEARDYIDVNLFSRANSFHEGNLYCIVLDDLNEELQTRKRVQYKDYPFAWELGEDLNEQYLRQEYGLTLNQFLKESAEHHMSYNGIVFGLCDPVVRMNLFMGEDPIDMSDLELCFQLERGSNQVYASCILLDDDYLSLGSILGEKLIHVNEIELDILHTFIAGLD